MTMHVCLSSDRNYAKHMATAMASVICNTSYDVSFYIMDGGIPKEYQDKLQELKAISNKEININILSVPQELFANYPIHSWALATYYRYLIPSLIEADRVLYLDCDIIVDKNIDEFWNTDLDGFYLAGVREHFSKLPSYVNAGVLLINNALWRADGIERKLFEYTANNLQNIRYVDQDVINAVCYGKIKLMSEKWNYPTKQDSKLEIGDEATSVPANQDACIYHFIGSKPWLVNTKTIYKDLYWKYFLMTAWAKEYNSLTKLLQKLHQARLLFKWQIKQLFKSPKNSDQ